MYQIYFFLQLLYSNNILATEQDYRSSPEVGQNPKINLY